MLVAVALSTLWTVLALRRPERTWHGLAAAVAAAWPVTARVLPGPARLPVGLRAAAGGLLVAVLTVAGLEVDDGLRGPSLSGAIRRRRRWVTSVLGALAGLLVLSARPRVAPGRPRGRDRGA